MEATYSGVITEKCFNYLRGEVIFATQQAKVIVINVAAVLSTTVLVPVINSAIYRLNFAPGVIICRPDQANIWLAYSLEIAKHGITRIVFSTSRAALALKVARTLAG
jgi:hypothetical protein